MQDKILSPLEGLYKKHRKISSDTGNQTTDARKLTKEWQSLVTNDKVKAEVNIKGARSERIDLIDVENQTAYELKVSGNNPEHEFYKDIFKVLAYNTNHSSKKIKKFVFISEQEGIESLAKSTLCQETILLVTELTIELVGIDATK